MRQGDGCLLSLPPRMGPAPELSPEQEWRRLKLSSENETSLLANALAMAAHDLRSPLSVVLGNLQYLARRNQQILQECQENQQLLQAGECDPLAEQKRELNQQLLQECQRTEPFLQSSQQICEQMQRFVDQSLDYNAIVAERPNLQMEWANLAEIAEKAFSEWQAICQQKNQHLAWELPKEDTFTWLDTHAICRVLKNLLENATQYTPEGGRIQLRCERYFWERRQRASLYAGPERRKRRDNTPNSFRISVEDNGCGVPPEYQQDIFEPLVRLGSGDRLPGKNLGLGLAISRGLVQAHAGKLWVESTGVGGSIFHLVLPVQQRAMGARN